MEPLDKLLAQLKEEYSQPNSESKKLTPPSNSVAKPVSSKPIKIPDFESEYFKTQDFKTQDFKTQDFIDNLLIEVKNDFEEKEKALESLKKEQQALKLEELRKKAKEWLDKLEPLSQEGIWFEKFAESYQSNLDAAIDYLGL
jgi:DNA repair exonuclease SbcCD ATPase subunit